MRRELLAGSTKVAIDEVVPLIEEAEAELEVIEPPAGDSEQFGEATSLISEYIVLARDHPDALVSRLIYAEDLSPEDAKASSRMGKIESRIDSLEGEENLDIESLGGCVTSPDGGGPLCYSAYE